jgi:hypothetical protein
MAILSQKARLSFLLWTNLAILQVEKTACAPQVLNDKPRGGCLAVKEIPNV